MESALKGDLSNHSGDGDATFFMEAEEAYQTSSGLDELSLSSSVDSSTSESEDSGGSGYLYGDFDAGFNEAEEAHQAVSDSEELSISSWGSTTVESGSLDSRDSDDLYGGHDAGFKEAEEAREPIARIDGAEVRRFSPDLRALPERDNGQLDTVIDLESALKGNVSHHSDDSYYLYGDFDAVEGDATFFNEAEEAHQTASDSDELFLSSLGSTTVESGSLDSRDSDDLYGGHDAIVPVGTEIVHEPMAHGADSNTAKTLVRKYSADLGEMPSPALPERHVVYLGPHWSVFNEVGRSGLPGEPTDELYDKSMAARGHARSGSYTPVEPFMPVTGESSSPSGPVRKVFSPVEDVSCKVARGSLPGSVLHIGSRSRSGLFVQVRGFSSVSVAGTSTSPGRPVRKVFRVADERAESWPVGMRVASTSPPGVIEAFNVLVLEAKLNKKSESDSASVAPSRFTSQTP